MTADGPTAVGSSTFTERFIEHLGFGIAGVPSHHAGGVPTTAAHALLRPQIGVSRTATQATLAGLSVLGLITEIDGALGRSSKGDRLRREIRMQGPHALVVAILRSGVMADQIRSLRPHLSKDEHGYICPLALARSAAPQLVGLLARMPDVATSIRLEIGRETALEIDSVWNELPPSSRTNWLEADKRKKAIGDRAELYSLQLERSAQVGALGEIRWVSRDDDTLGYDIEVGSRPARCVEVKGSAGRDVQFFISANEYKAAARHGPNYEVHFWGGINLTRDPLDEYEQLLSLGYPICVHDPTVVLSSAPWRIEPTQFKVTRPG